MQGKVWYKSRTLWVNVIAVIAFIIQSYTGFVVDPQLQAAVLGVLNVILRFDTSEPLKKRKPDEYRD